ncbi:S1C family serine protease [Chloroflexota bacterium]
MRSLRLFVIPILVLAVVASSGCITISPPETTTPAVSPSPSSPAPPLDPTWTPPPIVTPTGGPGVLPSIADVFAAVRPAVVEINIEQTAQNFLGQDVIIPGAGSGWIIDSSGIIVTNNHVVQDASTISITLYDDTIYEADMTRVYTDPLNDLAVLYIDAEGLSVLPVGDSASIRVGDWVISIGNALGEGIGATVGIVSRTNIKLQVGAGQTLYDLILTDAAINPGNSGGPLVNLRGEVIGITSAKVAEVSVEGRGYAISTATAIPIIEELITKGYVVRPWWGVSIYTGSQAAVLNYNPNATSGGALLTEIVTGSPAEQAGLAQGDIIIRVDSQDIASWEDLTHAIHESDIGQSVSVSYWRGDLEQTTLLMAIESPAPA